MPRRYSPREYRDQVLRRVEPELESIVQEIVRTLDPIWGGHAVTAFMRRVSPTAGPRSKNDSGPLRSITRRLARAIASNLAPGRVSRIERIGRGWKWSKGASTAIVPQVYNETGVRNGFGRGITIPARPFLTPALTAKKGTMLRKGEEIYIRRMRAILQA